MKTVAYKDFIKAFSEVAYVEDVPYTGSFEITPLCNLNCKMCYVHLSDSSVLERILSGEQWISIIEEAINQGMINALLTGGEAMMHPDFWKIYYYLTNNGISTRLKTNGLLLNRENIEKLTKYPPCIIDVSLYGCDRKSYKTVTGVDAYETVVGNIKMAIEAGLTLRIMVTPSSYMYPWIEKVIDLAKSFGVKVIVNSFLLPPNSDTKRNRKDFELTDVEIDHIQKIKNKVLYSDEIIHEDNNNNLFGNFSKRPDVAECGLYCNGGRTGFAMNWDGTMGPCISFPKEIICANPLEDGFFSSWKIVNNSIKNYTIPEECFSCPANNKCHYCPTKHGKYAIKHSCDPDVCSYWKDGKQKENTNVN